MRPLLSIIVPTINLPDIAFLTIRQILSIPAKDIEVVVRDSSNTDVLGGKLRALGDDRLRYEHSPPVSMTENWNRALELARGDYVCIVGHDDGVHPALIRIAQWASSVGADAVVYPYSAVYYWPDFPIKRRAGRVFLGECSGEVRLLRARDQLIRYIRSAGPTVLPRIYHGIVRRDCLEAMRRKTGQYLHSTAADDYFSYALCTTIDEFYFVDFPATIAGKCSGSNSGQYAARGDGSAHLINYDAEERVFDRRAPPNAKLESFKIHGLFTALEKCGATDLIDAVVEGERYASWYALSLRIGVPRALHSVRHLWTRALQDKTFATKVKVLWHVGREFSVIAVRKLQRTWVEATGGYTLQISGSDRQLVYPARDIAEAVGILEQEVGQRGLFATVDVASKKTAATSRAQVT